MEQKKAYRTFQFGNVVAWKSEFRGILSASGHPNVEVGNPPAFKGTPDVWSPEDLLIGALNACLMLTFLYQMQRRHLEVVAKWWLTKAAPKARSSTETESTVLLGL